jgi:long-chain acyl-CoA synthetase
VNSENYLPSLPYPQPVFLFILTRANEQQKALNVKKVWLDNYQNGVPKELEPLPYRSIADLFDKKTEKFSDKTAFIHMGYRLSYKELNYLCTQFAAYLQHLGLKKGDRVAIMLPNCMQYPIAIFGILKAGLVIVNTNPLYTSNEVSAQLKDAKAKAIIILENFAHTLDAALPNLPDLEHIILTNLGDVFGFAKKFLINNIIKYWKKMIHEHHLPNPISWQKTIAHHIEYQPETIDLTDTAFIQYTGGTTGISKGAMLSHSNMLSNVMQCVEWIRPICLDGEDRIVTALPLYHVFSLTANCFTFLVLGAENLLITNPQDLKFMIKEIKDYKFTAFTGVNTLFNILLHHPSFKQVDFSKLKLSLSGGMALQASVAQKWHEVTGTPILEAYGLTETSPGVCINPMYVKAFNGSVGLPLPSTEISLRDDKGNEVPMGESGELCVRGPQVMKEYWEHPDETKNVFWDDGFFKTGDIATIDENGFVYLVDRKKDMILVSGFNVYPNEVEQVIGMLPGVLEVGVIGVKTDETSEKVKACVVKTDPDLSAEDIRQHCRQYLTAYKVPKIIEFYDTLPKSNVGKILRRSLH